MERNELRQEVAAVVNEITIALLEGVFAEVWSRGTSSDEAGWTSGNPSYGHCAIAVLTAHEVLGGDILRYDLSGTPYEHLRSHYKLRLPGGAIEDFTGDQFRAGLPAWEKLDVKIKTREELLDPTNKNNEGTIRRYAVFRGRVYELVQEILQDLRARV
ncbi:MAG: hypothetical protein HYW90_05225 [Candidatus Sungbacteria bacterium]|nr:hypothetical protein [Candidatus Sungbacteria bacterium]